MLRVFACLVSSSFVCLWVLVSVGVGLGFTVGAGFMCGRCGVPVDPPPPDTPSAGRPSAGPPKISLFFHLSRTIFAFFSWGLVVEFWPRCKAEVQRACVGSLGSLCAFIFLSLFSSLFLCFFTLNKWDEVLFCHNSRRSCFSERGAATPWPDRHLEACLATPRTR